MVWVNRRSWKEGPWPLGESSPRAGVNLGCWALSSPVVCVYSMQESRWCFMSVSGLDMRW